MQYIIRIAAKIVSAIMPRVSKEILKAVDDFLDDLKERAAKTPNEWDDIFVQFLDDLFTEPKD